MKGGAVGGVELRDVTRANWRECVALKLKDDQADFVASNVFSLAESKFEPTFVPQAVYAGEALVGFVMYGLYPHGEPPLGHQFWVFRLMIDRAYQRQGYGRAALRAVIRRLRADANCREVLIGYEPENIVAAKLYRDLGFAEFGTAPWGERVARLKLRP